MQGPQDAFSRIEALDLGALPDAPEPDAPEWKPSAFSRMSAALDPQPAGPPKGVADFFREFDGSKRTPVLGTVEELNEAAGLVNLIRKASSGKASGEELAQISQWVEDGNRPTSFWYKVLDTVAEIPKFGVELWASGAVATGAKKGAQAGVTAAARKLGYDLAERSLKKTAAKTTGKFAAVLGASRVAAYEVSARVAAQEGLGAAYGTLTGKDTVGGRVSLSTYQKILQGVEFTENQHGALELVLNQRIPEFVEKLPAGILETFIETGSELAGGALTKLPLLAKSKALAVKTLDEWLKLKPGRSVDDFLKVLEKGGIHGPFTEVLEERLGDTARAVASGALPDDFEGIEGIFPGWEQLAVELVSFSVPGAAAGLASKAAGKVVEGSSTSDSNSDSNPSGVPVAGAESASGASEAVSTSDSNPVGVPVASTPTGGPTAARGEAIAPGAEEVTPGSQSSVGVSTDLEGARVAVQALRDQTGDQGIQLVDPSVTDRAEEFAGLQEIAAAYGTSAIPVEGSDLGKPLSTAGVFVTPGQFAVDLNSADPIRTSFHEISHNLEVADRRAWEDVSRALEELDPEGWAAAIAEQTARGGDLTAEEFTAVRVEGLANYLTTMAGPNGRAKVARALQASRGRTAFQKLLDTLKELLGKLSPKHFGNLDTARKRIEAASAALGEEFDVQNAELAGIVHQAFVGAAEAFQGRQAGGTIEAAEGGSLSVPLSESGSPTGAGQDNAAPASTEGGDPSFAKQPTPKKPKKARAARPGEVTEAVDLGEFSAFDRQTRRFADKLRRVTHLTKALELANGGKLPDDTDVETLARRLPGRIEKRRRDLEVNHLRPIIKAIKDAGLKWKEVNDYLWAKHVPEANEALQAKHDRAEDLRRQAELARLDGNPQLAKELTKQAKEMDPGPNAIAGMSTEKAMAEVKAYEAANPTALDIAKKVAAMNAEVRDNMAKDGLISFTARDLWASMFDWYVPLKTADTEGNDFVRGAGFSVPGADVYRRLGRKSRPDNVLTFSVNQAYSAIKRGETNQVGQAFYKGLTDLNLIADTKKVGEKEVIPEPADHELVLKFDGVDHVVGLKDPDLARALKNLNPAQMHEVFQFIHRQMRRLSGLITQWNPEFWLSNLPRDVQAAMVNVLEVDAKGLPAKILKGLPGAGAAVWRYDRKDLNAAKQPKGTVWDPYVERFHKAGARTGWSHNLDFEQRDKELQKAVEQGRVGDSWNKAMDLIGDANSAVELSTRVSVFRALVDSGMSDQQAGRFAREVTVDFNRGGEASPYWNAAYLFFNAGLQGNIRFVAAMAKSQRVRRFAIGIGVAGALNDAIQRAISPDDEDGEKVYDNIPQYVKDHNWIFMLPNGDFIPIPMPYAYNVPAVLGRNINEMLAGRTTEGEAVASTLKASLEAFSPWQGANLMQAATPSLLRPYVEVAQNENFAGNPIYQPSYPGDLQPDAERGKEYTSEGWKYLARALNGATGGDEVTSGLVDVSPESYRHVTMAYLGGVGKLFTRSVDWIENLYKGVDTPAHQIPFVRRFYGEPTPYGTNRAYYELRDDIKRSKKRIELHKERGAHQTAREWRQRDAPLLGLEGRLKTAESRLRKLRAEKRAATDDSAKEAIQERMDSIMAAFRKEANRRITAGA